MFRVRSIVYSRSGEFSAFVSMSVNVSIVGWIKKRPDKSTLGAARNPKCFYQRKWAKALLACAIRWTSSRRRMQLPSPL